MVTNSLEMVSLSAAAGALNRIGICKQKDAAARLSPAKMLSQQRIHFFNTFLIEK
jgi:hypothetical protein